MTNTSLRAGILATLMSAMLAFASPAWAETFTVTSTGDSGDGSLRQAIAAANDESANPGPDTISFDPSLTADGPATIKLSTVGDWIMGPSAFIITSDVTIAGPSGEDGITISRSSANGTQGFRLFYVKERAGELTIENLTLSGGLVSGVDPYSDGGGGGIYNGGTLDITNNTLSGNRSVPFFIVPGSHPPPPLFGTPTIDNHGGAIYNRIGGNLSIKDSRIEANESGLGGGIYAPQYTNVTVERSTFSSNSASYDGCGIYAMAYTVVRDSTFFANRADRGGSGISSADPGGGYLDLKSEGSTFSGNTGGGANGSGAISNTAWIDLGPDENGELHFPNWVNVRSSIVAGNAAGDIRGNYTDGGFNIVEGTAAEVGLETDGDGKAVLMDNGGPTETIALVPGSEAIDAGDSSGSTTDQRGEVRPSDYGGVPDAEGGDGPDVGAFERRTPASVPDFYATYEEQTLDVDAPGVVANDSSGEGGSPTAALVSGPAHGDPDLSPDGSFSYAPDPGYSGTDSFSYAAGDGASAAAPAGVEITVRNVVPPDTQITAGPNGSTNKPTVRFTFSSEPNATFECSLGNAAFEDCSSPKSYPGLPDGPHKFEVRAVDAAGKVDASPAGRSWTVDTAKPGGKLVINNGRANTPDRKVTLKTDARDPAPGDVVSMRFKNGGSKAWSTWRPYAASGPWNLTIGAGKKVVMAQFKDAAGNVSVVASDSIRYRP